MCNDQTAFVTYEELKTPLEVTLGDGYKVDAIRNKDVVLTNQLLVESVRNAIYIMHCMCPDCPSLYTTYLVCQK